MAHHTFNVNHTIPLKVDNVRMTLLYERINFAIDDYEKRHVVKFSNTDLAEYVDVTKQAVGDWRKGRTLELKGANLLNTALYLEINQAWLASNKSKLSLKDMRPPASKASRSQKLLQLIDSTSGLEATINNYIKADTRGREAIMDTAKREAARNVGIDSLPDYHGGPIKKPVKPKGPDDPKGPKTHSLMKTPVKKK